jgi:uncharacterized protein YjbI with pentapeptide repeats
MDVNLENARLERADLERSYLSGANLRNTNLKNYRGFPASVANAILDAATYGKSEWMATDFGEMASCWMQDSSVR